MNGSRKLRGRAQAEGQAGGKEEGGTEDSVLYGDALPAVCALVRRLLCDAAPPELSLLQVVGQEILTGSFTDSRKAALMAKVIRLC